MLRRNCSNSLALGLSAALTALGSSGSSWAADIKVDPVTKYQTMTGWEVTLSGLLEIDSKSNPSGGYDPSFNAKLGATIFGRLVNDLGINRVRLEVGSGQENPVDYFAQWVNGQITYDQMESHFYEKINDNSDPQVAAPGGFQFGRFDFIVETELLPIKALVEANGEKLYINLNYVDFAWKPLQGTLHHGGNPPEYAELVLAAFEHLKTKYGLTPNALEIILEPENTNDWKGGTPIGQAIVATKARLHAAGFDPEIIAPSVMNASNAVPYLNDILKVPGASSALKMLSYHRYGGGDYAGIRTAAESHGLQTGMLELTTANIDVLFEDLTVANISAWQKWGLVVDSRLVAPSNRDYAYILADFGNPSSPTIGFSANTGPLLPCFRYVRSGAVRIDARSSDSSYAPVAFINSNGSYVVVVRGNSGGSLVISGLPDGVYGVKSASFTGQITDGGAVTASGGKLNVTVPSGVTAVYDQKTLGPNRGGSGVGSGDGGVVGDSGAPVDAGKADGSRPSEGGTAVDAGKADGSRLGDGGTPGPGGSGSGSMIGSDAARGSAGTMLVSGATGAGGASSLATSGEGGDAAAAPEETASGCACRVHGTCSMPDGRASVALGSWLAIAFARRRRFRCSLARSVLRDG